MKITIRLKNPDLVIPAPARAMVRGAGTITGPGTHEVVDCSFWRRRIREGDVEIVQDSPKPAPKAKPRAAENADNSNGMK